MAIIGWIVFSFLLGFLAMSRGRSAFGWFLLALLISPIIAGIIVLILPAKRDVIEADQVATGSLRKCPMCAELIRPEALKCRFCGSAVEAEPAPTADEIAQRRYGG